jgi:hypothetical protein
MTDRDFFKLFEFVFVSGAILGILVWQLWSVRRSIQADKKAAEGRPPEPSPPPRHPHGE